MHDILLSIINQVDSLSRYANDCLKVISGARENILAVNLV